MNICKNLSLVFVVMLLSACETEQECKEADLVIFNSEIYTANEGQAKAAALDLGVNVSPFITLDSVVSIKENILSGDGVLTAVISDPEGEGLKT